MTFERNVRDSLPADCDRPSASSDFEMPYADGRTDGFGRLPATLQLRSSGAGGLGSLADAHEIAARATSGPATELPHLDTIQRAFGPHDVRGTRAHTDGAAAEGTAALGAKAFATGHDVAFAPAAADLHTAAHEAAHVVQQRAGVHLQDGMGRSGDAHERHADAVADAVVRGESAAALLDAPPSAASGVAPAVQRRTAGADQLGATAGTMLHIDEPVTAVLRDTQAIVLAKQSSEAILRDVRGGLPAHVGAGRFEQVVAQVMPSLADFVAIHERHGAIQRSPAAIIPIARSETDAAQRPIGQALTTSTPLVHDALTNLARVGLALEGMLQGQLPAAPAAAGVRAALARVGEAAGPLGWVAPADAIEADERRRAHDACPLGEPTDDVPGCHLSDAERVRVQGDVRIGLRDAGDAFVDACEPFVREIEAAIARDAAANDFLLGMLFEGVVAAVRAYVPGNSMLLAWAGDTAKSARRTFLRASANPELTDRAAALDGLQAAVRGALMDVDARILTLDDDALQSLKLVTKQLTVGHFSPRVKNFVERFRVQIAPLGHDRLRDPYRPLKGRIAQEPVWIRLDSVHKRLARVEHTLDGLVGPVDGTPPVARYTFQTWIDDDLQEAANADAAEVIDATEVADLPLVELMGARR